MPRWPRWITAEHLAKMPECLRFGDILYLSKMISSSEEMRLVKNTLLRQPNILNQLPAFVRESAKRTSPYSLLTALRFEYEHACEINYADGTIIEPEWSRNLPDFMKADLRANLAICDLPQDIEFIVPNIPHAGLGYIILEDGLVSNVGLAIGLWRLQGITQLANLTDPVVNELEIGSWSRRFEHTRLVHSLDAYVIMSLILLNNRDILNESLRLNGSVTGLLHDLATPAGGDGTKPLDPIAFSEEKNIGRFLTGEKWLAICERYGLDTKMIISAIQGEGILGKILDAADRIAYVARDVRVYLGRYTPKSSLPWPISYETIRLFAESKPHFCTVWDCVRIMDGKVVFTDPVRLADFLLGRIYMCKNLYYNSHARSFETILANTVLRYMYRQGIVKWEDFYRFEDYYLDRIIEDFIGRRYAMHNAFAIGEPFSETFSSFGEASERKAQLFEEGIIFSVLEDARNKIKTATEYLVLLNGKIMPFFEAFPEEAAKIQQVAVIEKPFYLFYLKNMDIKPEAEKVLREFYIKETTK